MPIMDFGFTQDQLEFARASRDIFARFSDLDSLRQAWQAEDPDDSHWHRLAELGVLGLLAPEAHGGLGASEVDLVLVLEEAGRYAVRGPLVEHAAVVVPTLVGVVDDSPDVVADWLDDAARGNIKVSAAPSKDAVTDGETADLVMIIEHGTVYAVQRGDIRAVRPKTSVDRTRRLAELDYSRALPIPGVDPVIFVSRGAAGTAAALCGLASRMIEMTGEYVKDRHQFGVPVGSFQAVKHHLADALIALEHARPAMYYAAWSLATHQPTAARDASFAKVYANEAAGLAARVALQCHGAIGYTFEHHLHYWLKRVWALQRAWGTTDQHRRQVADAVLA